MEALWFVHSPDVILMDLRMPEMEGVEAVRPNPRDRSAGARRRADDLRRRRGHRPRAAGRREGLHPQGHRRRRAGRVHPRRPRRQDLPGAGRGRQAGRAGDAGAAHAPELAALRLLANGNSNKEIAVSLEISERTVKTHLAHLFEKLGVTSRTEAVRVATRRGLVVSTDAARSIG